MAADGGAGSPDGTPAGTEPAPTADQLIAAFRDADLRRGYAAMAALHQLDGQEQLLGPLREFLLSERNDEARGWAACAITAIGGPAALAALLEFVRGEAQPSPLTRSQRRGARYTRFYAIVGIVKLAPRPEQDQLVQGLLAELRSNEDEHPLVVAGACLLQASQGGDDALATVRAMLQPSERDGFWPTWSALRALRDLPDERLRDPVLETLRNSRFNDHRLQAIRVLAGFGGDLRVVAELSACLRTSPHSFLRLEAAIALGRLADSEGLEPLLVAVCDENAEVRVQAAEALQVVCGSPAAAATTVVSRALARHDLAGERRHFLDAIRALDSATAAELLRKEMGGEDETIAKRAEALLVDLGGWAAVQRLRQRRATLKDLDVLLEKSEDVVKDTFRDTVVQARRNFYFALAVNVSVVVVGLVLIGVATLSLLNDPDRLASWILPGAAGVLGIVLNLFFNDPRSHARQDLVALMSVNVIFLGFLRQVNQIDATFKHAYMEHSDFGIAHMQETVGQLEQAVRLTLGQAREHLAGPSSLPAAQVRSTG